MHYESFSDYWETKKPQLENIKIGVKVFNYNLFAIQVINLILVITLLNLCGHIGVKYLLPFIKSTALYQNGTSVIATNSLIAVIFLKAIKFVIEVLKIKGLNFEHFFSIKDVFVFGKKPTVILFFSLCAINLLIFCLFFGGALIGYIKTYGKQQPNTGK